MTNIYNVCCFSISLAAVPESTDIFPTICGPIALQSAPRQPGGISDPEGTGSATATKCSF